MYIGTVKILAACLPFFMLQGECLDRTAALMGSLSKSLDGVNYRGKRHKTAPKQNIATAEEPGNEANDNFPFEKAQTKLAAEEVAGVRVKKGTLTLLSFNNTYFSESLQEDTDFSDLNFFRQYPRLVSIELNGLTLSADMLENLQKIFPATLKSLIIDSCNVNSSDIELLADIIHKHRQLESITVRLFTSSASDSSIILNAASMHPNMKFLNLAFGDLSHDGCVHLSSLISHSAETLQGLSLAWDKIVDGDTSSYQKLVDSLQEIKQLKQLDLSIMNLPENNASLVFESIGKLTHLNELKLFLGNLNTYNHIKLFESTEVLQTSLKVLTLLKVLDISAMHIPSQPMQLIAQALEHMNHLEILNISSNPIDVKTAEMLSESIKEVTPLKTLFANNCEMSDEAFSALCKNMGNSELRYLYFKGNKIQSYAKSLPIASMQDVLIIDFSENEMTYDDAMAFIKLTKEHPKLHIVNFKNNSGIEAMSGVERTIQNDQLVEWKIKNYTEGRQVSFFGL